MKVLAISDVSIGYGSRQIPFIVDYLGNFYNSKKIIIEPDQIERPPNKNIFPQIEIHRLTGSLHPHSAGGRIEYILNAVKLIDKIKPEILIICTTFVLPILFKINHKPKKVIYYCLESISHYQGDLEMNRNIDSLVDLIIFPEENRAANHLQSTGTKLPFCIVYNCTNDNQPSFSPSDGRNKKIIYHGGIHQGTAYKYFLNKKTQQYPIDMYGLIEAPTIPDKNQIEYQFLSLTKKVKYFGYLSYNDLEKVRKDYSFSIVIWLPLEENTLFACPNKFFESIYHGIPPITAPHPQCKSICNRYECGIVMEDFSYSGFLHAIDRALNLDLDSYKKLLANCQKAVESELNWEKQMQKVIKFLKN